MRNILTSIFIIVAHMACQCQDQELTLIRIVPSMVRAEWPSQRAAPHPDVIVKYTWTIHRNHHSPVTVESDTNSYTFVCNGGCMVFARKVIAQVRNQKYHTLNVSDSRLYYFEKNQNFYVRLGDRPQRFLWTTP